MTTNKKNILVELPIALDEELTLKARELMLTKRAVCRLAIKDFIKNGEVV
jgi:hypothetical protein